MNFDIPASARGSLLCALLLALLSAVACTEDTIAPKLFGDVYGEVLDRDGNAPIVEAFVTTNPPTSSVTTDDDGRFRLVDIPEGTYSLRAEREGYLTEVASVTVFGDQDASVIVRLRTDSADNTPPTMPTVTFPADGARGLPTSFALSWSGADDDADDVLRYDVTLFGPGVEDGRALATQTTDTSLTVDELRYGTTYRWQVAADDGRGAPVLSAVATFTTQPVPDYRILFARSDGERYDVYATDGLSGEIRLTDGPASNWRPRLNPQRTRVAFVSNENAANHLYTVNRDGSDRRRVTAVPIAGTDPLDLDFCWSPDGAKLLYPGGANLYEVNPDGTGLRVYARAPAGLTFAGCDWSDQAQPGIVARLVGGRAYDATVARVGPDGSVAALLPNLPGALGGARLSIPGTQLLYSRDASGFEALDGRQLDARVSILDLFTGALVDLSVEKTPGTNDLDPVYSPDGARVLLVNRNNDGLSPGDLVVVQLDGMERRVLVEDAEMPEWR